MPGYVYLHWGPCAMASPAACRVRPLVVAAVCASANKTPTNCTLPPPTDTTVEKVRGGGGGERTLH